MAGVLVSQAGSAPQQAASGYETSRFRALGHDFSVRVAEPVLGRHLEELFGPCIAAGSAATRYTLTDVGYSRRDRLRLEFDGTLLATTPRPSEALAHLMWHINREVVEQSRQFTLLHAAALALDGVAVLLPAPMESGKTTLAAGLLCAGLGYLTDEAAAIDPATLAVHAYPKPLSIDKGSWTVLAHLRPELPPELQPYYFTQWLVPPTRVRPDAVVPVAEPRLVIVPRYERGARTRLEPAGRAGLLEQVAGQTFNFHDRPRRELAVLAEMLRRSRCYQLIVGDLDAACRLVIDALEAARNESAT